ncbi:MAG: ABC transporter substrate-binding protein [Acetobacteraceae bacterium]
MNRTSMAASRRVALAAVLAGAVFAAGPAAAQQQEVRLGWMGAITGPIAQLVPPILRSSQMAVDQINEQGGILGGRRLTMISADGQCNAQGGTDATNKLINVDQVVAIVGGLCSGETIAGANSQAIPNGVVMVSPSSTSPLITGLQDRDLIFRVVPSDAYQGQVMARMVWNQGLRRVAVTHVNNDYGRGLGGAFRDAFTALGGTVTAFAAHEDQRASYRTELATLARGNPEALVIAAYGGGSGLTIIRQALEGGFFNRFIGGDGMRDDVLPRELGPNLNITVTQPVPRAGNPGLEMFQQMFTAIGQNPSAIFVAQAYDAAFALALAIQHSGGTDRARISASLRAVTAPGGTIIRPGQWREAVAALAAGQRITYVGASGPIEFDANGDVPGNVAQWTIQGGTFVQGPIITTN